VIALPPVLGGGLHERVAFASPGVAVTLEGDWGGKIMRETLELVSLVTHTLDPSGLTATPMGPEPTVIVLVTRLVEVLIREMVVPWPPS
jgi:hypothetical protein